ncbi:MAG: cytidine deaminase [Clostridiales bacterium]|nr:cytidine deaminase [Clostridiales bacterium]
MNVLELIEQAKEAAKYSYSPYSSFTVGAALLAKSGEVYLGCNIENAAFSPSCCAERTAFFKAVSEGEREFEAIAIVGGKDGNFEIPCPPCGVCRQVMSEFCSFDFKIYLGTDTDEYAQYSLGELLPASFVLEE